jgi:hypothetical protein
MGDALYSIGATVDAVLVVDRDQERSRTTRRGTETDRGRDRVRDKDEGPAKVYSRARRGWYVCSRVTDTICI